MQNEFDYRKYLALLNKHKRLFAVVALLIMTGAAVASYVLPKKYGANSTFFIEKNVLNELLRPTNSKTEMEDALKGLNYSLKSRSLFVKVMNDLDVNISSKSDSQLEALIMDLQKNTECKLNKEEGLITVSFTDKSPRFARDFVNALVRRYIEQNLSAKREESYGASTFLAEQAASVKEKLDKIENEIGRLRAEKGAALGVEPAGIQAEINTGQQRLDELILRRSQLEASRNQLRSNNPAKNRVTALQRRLDELRVEYTENYPEVLKVKADIEAAQKDIGKGTSTSVADPQELARVEAELSAVRASEASQRSIIANSRGLMHANPAARTAMEKLEQEKATGPCMSS
jgi:polysaccharide chain length determinant protein (PEP-CTERM system associated)